jgi:hypothetical protein
MEPKGQNTVDELEPKGQNQDSPHQNAKVGEPPRTYIVAEPPIMSSILSLYLNQYTLYRFLVERSVYLRIIDLQ